MPHASELQKHERSGPFEIDPELAVEHIAFISSQIQLNIFPVPGLKSSFFMFIQNVIDMGCTRKSTVPVSGRKRVANGATKC